jgi:methionyl-tRNA formyltransferase
MSVLQIVIAGSTHHTRLIAETLQAASLQIVGCITPQPRPIGRKQVTTPNPLHDWAIQHQIPTVLIDKKIERGLETTMHQQFGQPDLALPFCDILLVVDFGYYMPGWLLQKAGITPLNIHPSLLPRWRGSSPGQFALLYGDNPSAVSLITVAQQMDQGAIWYQQEFEVRPEWDVAAYYQHAFTKMAAELPGVIAEIGQGNSTATEQPLESPTPVARKITKPDCFVPWSVVRFAQTGGSELIEQAQAELRAHCTVAVTDATKPPAEPPLLAQLLLDQPVDQWAVWLSRAIRAFSQWPKVWTLAPTVRGQQRLLLHQAHTAQTKLVFDLVQLEGQQPATFQQIKTSLT